MRTATLLVSAVLTLVAADSVLAQDVWDPRVGHASRAELERLLQRLEGSAESPVYSGRLRTQARREAAVIRQRLQQGDFQVGDRVLLVVEGETTLSDTFTVREGPELPLPNLATVSLAGVLRSEVQGYLRDEIARYVRDPVVRARTLIRLSITGAVARPGFYSLPTGTPITEALMAAGGPTPAAKLDEIRVERQGTVLWGDERTQQALAEGRTLDELSLRAGDRIVVEEQGTGLRGMETPLRAVMILITLPAAIFGLIRIF